MSAASQFGMAANFILFSIGWSIVAKIIDTAVQVANSLQGMPMDMYDTVGWLVVIYTIGPISYLLALVLNHLVQSYQEGGMA
jgi:hypothetical protein